MCIFTTFLRQYNNNCNAMEYLHSIEDNDIKLYIFSTHFTQLYNSCIRNEIQHNKTSLIHYVKVNKIHCMYIM